MSRPSAAVAARRRPTAGRRGTILVVVLALLAIFAVIGIAFVFYSDGEMTAARYAREAENRNGSMRPTMDDQRFASAAEAALASIIFGDYNGQLDALRGHDLLSAMYPVQNTGNLTGPSGTHPYTGQGIFHEKMAPPFNTIPSRGHVVNYTAIPNGTDAGNPNAPSYAAFDPELTGPPRAWDSTTKPGPGQPLPWAPPTAEDPSNGKRYVSKAAPYTYPDLNNFYLASVVPSTGETILPSYFRPWHFNTANVNPTNGTPNLTMRLFPWNPNDVGPATNTAANTDWVTLEGRARTLRPRPIDQLTGSEIQGITGQPRPPTSLELAAMAPGTKNALFTLIDNKIRKGEIIGYPRPNSDGTITGDGINFLGGVGVQRNDSILVDFGAPSFPWPPTAPGSAVQPRVKPLALIMIRDLDGLLHLNAHGNLRNNGQHASHHGLGPWEVNLALGLGNPAEVNEVVRSRYGKTGSPAARNKAGSLPYAPGSGSGFAAQPSPVPSYALVGWGPMGTAAPLQIPTFTATAGLSPSPFFITALYPPAGVYDDNTGAAATAHPALYNPGEWTAFPDGQPLNPLPAVDRYGTSNPGFSYPPADTRRLQERYAGDLDLYRQTTFFRLPAPPINTLIGNGATYPPGTATYRNDPAHGRRLLTTTIGNDIDRPRLSPTNAAAPTLAAGPPTQLHMINTNLGAPLAPLPAATPLPALDLNRPLADYRDLTAAPNVDMSKSPPFTPQPLGPGNMANKDQAGAERHNLARDVFARLVQATGASASVNPATGDVTVNGAAPPEQIEALRYLAQLAANVVDYVDNDDVITTFVWNPTGGGAVPVLDASSYATFLKANMTSQAEINARVVFGVEMPRLVINEVYSEVVNDRADDNKAPANKGRVRFWAELLNPSVTPYSGAAVGPLGDGSVSLTGANPPYKLVITRDQSKSSSAPPQNEADYVLKRSDNVTGSFQTPTPDIEYDFRNAGPNNSTVKPNNGAYNPNGNPGSGIVIVGPVVNAQDPSKEFDPTNGFDLNPANNKLPPPPWDNMIQTPAAAGGAPPNAAMEYLIESNEFQNFDNGTDFNRHVVLLRRLANPYLPYDVDGTSTGTPNPYITVDVMDYVPANDAVYATRGNGKAATPINARAAYGRVQPMAGYTDGSGTFPKTFVLAQTGNGTGNQPKHTLGMHNGPATQPTANTYTPAAAMTPPGLSTTTIWAPFDWFVHLDRPLVNELELLHVQAVKPHLVTQWTLRPGLANPATDEVRRNVGLAPWLGVSQGGAPADTYPTYDPTSGKAVFDVSAGAVSNKTSNALYRALELLRVKSRVYGSASGGRVAGKVNVNTVQDARVLLALLDPQSGNAFTAGEVYDATNPSNPATIWGRYIGSRTRGLSTRLLADGATQVFTTTPGKTLDDDPFDVNWGNLDRPFKSFGVAEAGMPPGYGMNPPPPQQTVVGGGNSAANDGKTPPTPTPFGPGLQDTLLRVNPGLPGVTVPAGLPLAYTVGGGTAGHPYLQAEALRKLMGNVTTVSNTFAVHVTIVYHYTRGSTLAEQIPTPPTILIRERLGPEAFREVPGDLRQQFFAIVDRSNAMVNSAGGTAIQSQPFQSATKYAVAAGATQLTLANYQIIGNNMYVGTDGQLYPVNGTIFIGSGSSVQQLTVTAVNPPPMGATDWTISVNPAVTNAYPINTLISNGVTGRPAYPGPNAFTPFATPGTFPHTGLVPYAARVR